MDWINYQHLYYLWHIGRYGSVTKAAEKLRLAQPTISAQIRTFEDNLGEKLLEKKGRNVVLTEAGYIAFNYAEKIFSLGQELKDTLTGSFVPGSREINIGILDVVPKILAYRIIQPAFHNFSNLTVNCNEGKFDMLLSQLASGELDLLISDRPVPAGVSIKAYNHFLGDSGVSFLASKKIKNELRGKFPLCLKDANMLLPSSECTLHGQLLSWFEKKNVKPKVVANFQDTAIMKITASEGVGVLPLPSIIAKKVSKEFDLHILGSTSDIKEPIYVISLERRLKHDVIIEIFKFGMSIFKER